MLLLVVLAGVAAVLLAPRLVKGDLPTDSALLGTPARGVVKADRDYALIDAVATEGLRVAGARQKPVWDLDNVRARSSAHVLQKSLVRIAVSLESLRELHTGASGARDLPRAALPMLEPVRAVTAGELALIGVEAPRDDTWVALVTAIWRAPDVCDGIVDALTNVIEQPILQGPPPDEPIVVVRPLADGAERVVEAAYLLSVETARAQLRTRIGSAINERATGLSSTSVQGIASFVLDFVRTNLTFNAAETDARRRHAAQSVPPVVVRAHRGETVLRPGEIITPRHQILAEAMAVQQAQDLRARATLGTAAFVALLCGSVYLFGARRVFRRTLRFRDVAFLAAMLVVELLAIVAADAAAPFVVARVPGVPSAIVYFAVPVALGAMAVRLMLPPDVALLFALVTALLGGVVVEPGMSWAVVAVMSSMTGAALVTQSPRRSRLLFAGIGAGVVGVLAAITLELFRGALAGRELLWLLGSTLLGGVLSGVLVIVLTPAIEALFGYVTDHRMYRLADLNHPLLKDLIVHAPGTWHHSVRVAVLAEAAARAVGANPLLARVMALFHDVGKIAKPLSFAENQHGDNPHDRLSPEESATVLRGHVEEGLALARRHELPRAVRDVIEEHHVDNLMEQFHQRALQRAVDSGLDPKLVDERLYRYRGRAPQTRESALVMLADQIEAASRALDAATVPRLGEVVDAFVNRALTSDTLAACDLSLRDLGRARSALKEALLDLERRTG